MRIGRRINKGSTVITPFALRPFGKPSRLSPSNTHLARTSGPRSQTGTQRSVPSEPQPSAHQPARPAPPYSSASWDPKWRVFANLGVDDRELSKTGISMRQRSAVGSSSPTSPHSTTIALMPTLRGWNRRLSTPQYVTLRARGAAYWCPLVPMGARGELLCPADRRIRR